MVALWRIILTVLGVTRARGGNSTSTTDTEFTAEVVRITEVLPHPNADRLEIAKFEMKGSGPSAYEVVIQKGAHRPGDTAAYFSVDCLLPTANPEFAFLTQRLDGKGKDVFRLRAARLRGVFSQGLLVPAPSGSEFGDPMAELFGVEYHRAPEVDSTPGTPNQPKKKARQPWTSYSVGSLKKLPRLFQDGEPVVVTEKIHGTNFRFGWVRRRFLGIPTGWEFRVGSHHAMKGAATSGFYGEDVWTDYARMHRLADRTRDYKGYLFVGELYGYTYSGRRIQDLTYGRTQKDGPGLGVFDVKDDRGCWLPVFERACVLADCDLPAVPELYRGPFDQGVLNIADGRTTIGFHKDHIREGIVVESFDRKKKAKFVSAAYLLRGDK